MSFILKKYLISFLAALISTVVLLLVIFFPINWLFGVVVVVWLLVSSFLFYYLYAKVPGRRPDLITVLLTEISFVSLLILVEWNFLRWLLLILCTFFIFLLFAKLNESDDQLLFEQKPVRRMKMMLLVFDAYAFLTLGYAISMFFQDFPFIIIALVEAIIMALISLLIWRLYFAVPVKSLALWALIVSLIVLELMAVCQLWPLGYLVLGALLAWLWFILQLFIRFHLSPQGIIWKKQLGFLLSNLVLFILLLMFLVRWI
jgi:hypothetical protein